MGANDAFLTRLSQIAGETACDDARTANAAALVHAYATALYGRLGITEVRRPTARAKEIGKAELEELRREVLRAEIAASAASAIIFAAVRDRIEMARRALALRVAAGDGASPIAEMAELPRMDPDADRPRLQDIRARLGDRRAVAASWLAIRHSHELLDDQARK